MKAFDELLLPTLYLDQPTLKRFPRLLLEIPNDERAQEHASGHPKPERYLKEISTEHVAPKKVGAAKVWWQNPWRARPAESGGKAGLKRL